MKKDLFIFIIAVVFLNWTVGHAQLKKADSLKAVGEYGQAIWMYENIENHTPQIEVKLAKAFQATGNYGQALAHYKNALSQDSSLVRSAAQYTRLLQKTKAFKKADSVLSRLTKRFPDNPEFHYQLGLARKHLGDSTSIEEFRHAVRLNPTHQKALYQSAVYHFKHGEFEKVEALGQKALSAYSGNLNFRLLLARNAYAARDYKKAVTRLEKLAEQNNLKTTDYRKLGFAYYRLNKKNKAIKAFKLMHKKDKTNPDPLFNIGLLYNQKNEYRQAEHYFQASLALRKQGLDKLYLNYGLSLKGDKKYKQAMYYFRKALKENPSLARAQFELAVCADAYFKDFKMRRGFYKRFVEKFKPTQNTARYIELSQRRITALDKKIHMAADSLPSKEPALQEP